MKKSKGAMPPKRKPSNNALGDSYKATKGTPGGPQWKNPKGKKA